MHIFIKIKLYDKNIEVFDLESNTIISHNNKAGEFIVFSKFAKEGKNKIKIRLKKGGFKTTYLKESNLIINLPIKVHVDEICGDFQKNEIVAEEKYQDRRVYLTGKVSEVSKSIFSDEYYVRMRC